MREPGANDYEGEYHQMAIGEAAPAPTLGADLCRCAKPPGCWGASGFHFRPNERYPDSVAAAVAYEPCSAYAAAVKRRSGSVPGRRGRRG